MSRNNKYVAFLAKNNYKRNPKEKNITIIYGVMDHTTNPKIDRVISLDEVDIYRNKYVTHNFKNDVEVENYLYNFAEK